MTVLRMTILALCAVASAVAQSANAKLVAFELEDHDRARYSNEMWNGQHVVLFLADRKGSQHDRNYAWTSPLAATIREQLPGSSVVFASIADLRGTPRLARGFVRGMFEQKPQDPVGRTLLDWDGVFFKAYELEAATLHLLVFNRQHALVYRVALREVDEVQLQRVRTELKALWPN